MPTTSLSRLLFLTGCLSGALFAQTESPIAPPPSAAKPAAQRPAKNMSRDLSAALTAGIKFEDPAAAKKKQEEEEMDPDVDLRDIDKPRNTIIRLPKYVVEGERPPVFSEKDIHTKKGLADLAVRRYLSSVHGVLNKYRLPLIGMSNEQIAMMMYEEDQRLRDMKDYGEKVYLYRTTGDTQSADSLENDIDRTFMRKSTFAEPPSKRD